jgi:hypothetical protein
LVGGFELAAGSMTLYHSHTAADYRTFVREAKPERENALSKAARNAENRTGVQNQDLMREQRNVSH